MSNEHDQFLRSFPMRGPEIMWFLGAGASASAGIPTAWHMIWEFKRSLFCSSEKKALALVQDLADNRVRDSIQASLDSTGRNPPAGADDEYSHYFETAYPDERDRRSYIDGKVAGGVPSYGHLVLAALMKLGQCDVVWTTNFDRVVEDAASRIYGSTTALRVVALDNVVAAQQALSEKRFPVYVKLHGDYHSRALKNTTDELRAQDASLRQCLIDACRTRGLAVVGFSGRDRSVMETLTEAASLPGSFPAGLFWFHRPGEEVDSRVERLISVAGKNGVRAQLVKVDTFDELLGDIPLLLPDIPEDIGRLLRATPRPTPTLPLPEVGGVWPVLRLNALCVHEWPKSCRLVECEIGGTREVRECLSEQKVDAIAVRAKPGVLAFGRDQDLRRAFENRGIRRFDLHEINPSRLSRESAELGLLYQAICRAVVRGLPLTVERRGRRRFLKVATDGDPVLRPLRKVLPRLSGVIPATELRWTEAAEVRLEFRLNRLWLIILPTILAERTEDPAARVRRMDFVRNELASRYNKKTNELVAAWAEVIVGAEERKKVKAFGGADGIDATFEVGQTTAFSWRRS
jgi:hypothetical protein